MKKKVSKEDVAEESFNRFFIEYTRSKPIAFIPLMSKIAGSASAGLLMSQLLFWWGKGIKEEWIYKTISEIREETTLSRHEQDTAIRKWKSLGVLKTKLEGIPPKRHFQVDIEKLKSLANKALEEIDMSKNG